ncbi:MAG: ATP-binding protein [Pedosphaera sp.]|nr:ATP-binding protein [Pedosphaera sp.]
MTANNIHGARDTVELLARLKNTANQFSIREETLLGTERRLRGRETAASESARAEFATQSGAQLGEATIRFNDARDRRQALFAARSARISRAHKNVLRQAQLAADQITGRGKFTLQKGLLDAERLRDSNLAGLKSSEEEFNATLLQTQTAFAEIEGDASGSFRGYIGFKGMLAPTAKWPDANAPTDPDSLRDLLFELQGITRTQLDGFRRNPVTQLFRWLPIWLVAPTLLGLYAGAPFILQEIGGGRIAPPEAERWILITLGLAVALYLFGHWRSKPLATRIAINLARFRPLHPVCLESSGIRFHEANQQLTTAHRNTVQQLNEAWWQAEQEAETLKTTSNQAIRQKVERIVGKNQKTHDLRLSALTAEHQRHLAALNDAAEAAQTQSSARHLTALEQLSMDSNRQWQDLEREWRRDLLSIFTGIESSTTAANALAPEWNLPVASSAIPHALSASSVKFGTLEIDIGKLVGRLPVTPRLALPGPKAISTPLCLTSPDQSALLIESGTTGAAEAVATLNNIVFRLLSTTPAGRLSLTLFDPGALGQSFSGLMHLADYEDSSIDSRIWTQPAQIEEKLADINDHMEKVIQMYLRNEFETIEEYNQQAGALAEKYHLLVIAGFPVNFTDTAARRLVSIVTSGGRCGIFTLIHWDARQPTPPGFIAATLREKCVRIVATERGFELADMAGPGQRLVLDPPPPSEVATALLHRIGRESRGSNRVEVPFSEIAPQTADLWTEETTEELRVPIGRTRATQWQYLTLGKGTLQHVLIAGKTGSGKSTLFHTIITNLALRCSPEQVEFYLVDFKKGVEFKPYATHHLPHARVIAIESDREFGLSVLERVDEELRRRGDLFRKLGVQDLPGYKKAGGGPAVPRCLLLIDEFQEFFVEEDRTSQNASVLLDRIVRQGRAFGIHVLLGSQTLGGAYTLARATLGQMVIRIALQCNEADSYLIMDESNAAPRLLSRPGEGIYNPMAGALEGNSPFQVAWLSEEQRESSLNQIHAVATKRPIRSPRTVVFEGNVPADIRENQPLHSTLASASLQPTSASRIWLGVPNSIKGPTEVVFENRSRCNLLVVGQHEEAAMALLSGALISLAAQHPRGTARLILFDTTPPESPQRQTLERIANPLTADMTLGNHSTLAATLNRLAAELKQGGGDSTTGTPPITYLFINGLQNYPQLRQDDDFSFSVTGEPTDAKPSAVLLNLVNEGAAQGIHVIALCDTYNNVNRFLGRKGLAEFDFRVLFQMSASDSSSLVDSPDASLLGLHRALLYNDREGRMEKFRPYSPTPSEWLDTAIRDLGRLRKG